MSDSHERRRSRIRLGIASVGIALIVVTFFRWGAGKGQPTDAGQMTPAAKVTAARTISSPLPSEPLKPVLSADEVHKQNLLGIWTHLAYGQQWIENRPNGTARMYIQFDFLASLIYGGEIHLDLTWDVKDGILSHTIVQGTPPANVEKLIRDYGQTRTYKVLKTGDQQMQLESIETTPEIEDWTRTASPQVWMESVPAL